MVEYCCSQQVDESPIEADTQDPDQISANSTTPQTSGYHDNQLSPSNHTMTPEEETVTKETITNHLETVSDKNSVTEMSPLSEEVGHSQLDEARTASSPVQDTPESPEHLTTNGIHDNLNCVSMVTEDEKIQELMSRSDTAVIFPEPVSDQEEGNNTTENEDLGDLEDDLAKCPHCELSYSSLEELRDHWQSAHSGQTSKYACPQCTINFMSKSQLDKHLALHSPSAQICKICKKTFANVYRLQRHMISHEESSELRKFKCPECHKAFKFKHHLKEHIRIHSGEKPFECQNCGKRFSHSGSYSSHMTSKKCWVVNMKMRGTAGPNRLEKTDGLNRTLVPKALENGMDMNLAAASMMYGSGLLSQQFLQFDTASQIQNQYLSQNPFLPHIPFTTAMNNPMMPSLASITAFGCLPPVGTDPDTKISGSKSETASLIKCNNDTVVKMKELTPIKEIIDENMNQELKKPKLEISMEIDQPKHVMDTKIHKVLEIVDATVNQQQQVKDEKVALSKLSADASPVSPTDNESRTLTALASAATQQLAQLMKETKVENAVDINADYQKEAMSLNCKFCHEVFSSPISLHQHERYLCKLNLEIQRKDSEVMCNGATSSPAPSNSVDDSMDEYDNERKVRVRSMITDEQVQVLKSFYQTNQRPNKFELESLARQIGFPKRVVQVWFQNMRARDRRKGRVIRDVKTEPMSPNMISTYIPIVPQVAKPSYYAPTAAPTYNGHTTSICNTSASPQRACEASFEAEQPLDLTMKVPEAHTSKPFSSRPEPGESDEVLNLSIQKKESSPIPATMAEPALLRHYEDSNIVQSVTSACVPLVVPVVTSPTLAMTIPLQINTTPAHSKSYASISSMQHTPAFTNQSPAHAHHYSAPRPAYDPNVPISCSPSLASSDMISPRPSSLDSSFNSTLSLDSTPDSGAASGGLSKIKRARKKSWRQVSGVEAEELTHFDESIDEDGDSPSRKKRRSWKQHRVDVAEGLYACDQCDKMFNKQSSLARHKYEHSGQRPFPCDICTKAFKHKHHLTEHKRLHSGEKPFQCQKCAKRFSHSGSYSQHMNHRYKYCKPLMGEDCENDDIEMEGEHSDACP